MTDVLKTTQTEEVVSELKQEDITAGYLVALDKNGKFHFQLLGPEVNMINLLGINQLANIEVVKAVNNTRFEGDAITMEVGKAVGLLHTKLDALTPKAQ